MDNRFSSLEELIKAIDTGLDIEFRLQGKQYNISPAGNKKFFICICPDGEAVTFDSGKQMVQSYAIASTPLQDLWEKIDIISM